MKRDDGFTLIELLIATSLLTIVFSVIAGAIIVALQTTNETEGRLRESTDQQLVAAYFVPDMQSASNVSLTGTECSGGLSVVVRFSWVDEGVKKVASYITETVGGEKRVDRRYCESSGAIVSGTTPVSVIPVAHSVGTTDPAVACSPSCPGVPDRVTLTVTEESGYAYSVAATRRTS